MAGPMEGCTRFYIYTFGCRCNQADSSAMRHGLCRRSLEETSDPCDADFIVVNTCTVTHRADQQARQTIRKLHRENPDARVVVTGCYAERDPEAVAKLPGVSVVVGNAQRDSLADILHGDRRPTETQIWRAPIAERADFVVTPMSRLGGKTRPLVKLQDGCDARCSYCIVPQVRGPGRSARPEDVLREIENLVHQGFQEVVLTGVHLGAYGRKLDPPVSLLDLLKKVLEIPKLGRLRLSSIEPMRFSRNLVRLAAENPAFAPHFHIPLQSGSDRILRRMRRPYSAASFLDLMSFIRESLPHAGLGTDLLVGFPGETDTDFERTCEVIRQSPLTYLHVFPFSAREGTSAFSMSDKVPSGIIKERAHILRGIGQAKNLEFRKRFVGQVLSCIGLAKEEELGECVALTGNYINVLAGSDDFQPNRLLKIRIDRVQPEGTWGTFI